MISKRSNLKDFKEGDQVVLVDGTYPGTSGVFLNLRPDPNWADIQERSGCIRSHPLVWLEHFAGSHYGRRFERPS